MKELRTDLRAKTRAFAVEVVRLFGRLPRSAEAQVLGRQLLRSGTSVGAHYREAYRSRSDAEFISKIEGGLQELDETMYWLELLIECEIVSTEQVTHILAEANELSAIFVTMVRNVKRRNGRT